MAVLPGVPELSAEQPIAGNLKPTSLFKRFMDSLRTAFIDRDTILQAQIDRITRGFIAISHADGLTITAEADGATAKATVSSHLRIYLDLSVSVTGGVLTGLAYNSTYSIYYDDLDREGGAVTYVSTLDATEAVTSEAHPVRHLVGLVTTPATAGDPPTDGGGTVPPGFPGGGYEYEPL